MPFVTPVTQEQAGPELKQLFEQIRNRLGFLPNYFQALGRTPAILAPHLEFGGHIMKDGAVSRTVKEQIGLVVSGINSSSYCIAIHMEFLRQLGVEKPLGRKLTTDYPSAPVGEKIQTLFRFADKLTRKPFEIEQEDADAVLQAGWDEAALYETVLTVAYFNFVNRFSIGLGLVADF